MKNGGYLIIDLHDKALTADGSTETEIPGIYDAIEGNYRKRVVLSGLTIGTTEYPDMQVVPYVSGTDYKIAVPGHILTVPDDDDVICTKNAVAEAAGTNPTKAEYKALLDALVAAGIIQLST